MKNKLFGKATAFVMGSMVLFSSQAFANTLNNSQELSGVETLGESELIIAQPIPGIPVAITVDDRIALSRSVAEAATALGNASSIATSAAFTNPGDAAAISQSLATATSIIGNATSLATSAATTDDAAAVAESLSEANTFIGDATAIALADAESDDAPAVAEATAEASTVVGNATAIATSIAESGSS